MRKVLPLATAIVLFALTIAGTGVFLNKALSNKGDVALCFNVDERNFCPDIMEEILERNGSIPVFGSSELTTIVEVSFPYVLFQEGNSDFNMILIGRGYTQSLHQAINLGAMAEDIPNRKAVLILSPQWFSAEDGINSSAYASRFSERMYVHFLKNRNLSRQLRTTVGQRVESLLVEDPRQLEQVKRYNAAFLRHDLNPMNILGLTVYDAFMELKADFGFFWATRDRSVSYEEEMVYAENIDFEALGVEADRVGAAACTNNIFYIRNDYYETYLAEDAMEDRNTWGEQRLSPSMEYTDLTIFLETCKESGIEPLVINVPMKGSWYDWRGFPKEERESYYQNIRNICNNYGVELADFSDKEYEPYFLRDIMHLGWKGWVYVDEAVYKFYQGE